MSSPFTAEFEPNAAEFTQVWLVTTRRFRWIATGTCLLAGPLIAGGLYLLSSPNLSWIYLLAGWLFYMGLSLPWTARRRIKKYFRQHPFLGEPTTISFDDNFFSVQTYSGTNHLRWHTFSHWKETDTLFLLFRGPMMSTYLPKRALPAGGIEHTRNVLRRMIGRTSYSRPVHAFAVEASPNLAA